MKTRRLIPTLSILMILLATALMGPSEFNGPPALQAAPFSGSAIVRVYFDDPETARRIAIWIEPLEAKYEKGYLVLEVSEEDYDRLVQAGLQVEIDETRKAQMAAAVQALQPVAQAIPGFACYRTVEETFDTAATIAGDHPTLATWTDVGDSWEKENGIGGYDLMVLKLTHSAIPGPKPKIFITSAIHAREYTTAELMTRMAEYLVNNYGTDADATWLLDHHEIHLMLQANPDGRKQAETGLSWRKNTNQDYCSPTSNNRGADLNRNFPFQWGCCGGSSGDPCSLTYRGVGPASEPETQAVQNYIIAQFPDQRGDNLDDPAPMDASGIYLDVHSSGRLILWPWGFTNDPAPNGTQLQTLGRKLAYFNGHTPEQGIGLYPTDGTTTTFAYGEMGLAAFTYELGREFFESCSYFENTLVPDNMPSLIYAMKVARTPYMTPAGPDALNLDLSLGSIEPGITAGTPVNLSAVINDARYNNSNGTEPTQNIVAAEYYVETPPWAGGTSLAMSAADGNFDTSVESATAVIDTADLEEGRHIIFVRGRDNAGNWGAFSAVFLYIAPPCVLDSDCNDGDFCNGIETCVDGVCLAGSDQCPTVFEDDFENGNVLGWDLYAPGSTASTGEWEFGDPNGTVSGSDQAQPENAFAGSGCAFTAQNSSLGSNDVDGGVVYLLSPPIDLSGETGAVLSYERWFYNRDLGEDAGDFFVAEVSDDNGATWVNLETLGSGQSANTWSTRSFDLEIFISLTSTVRLRFGAADGPATGNIIEAAIDNVVIQAYGPCVVDADCDDGQHCNGAETCEAGSCQAGADPCPGQSCDEAGDVCLPAGSCLHSSDFETGAGGWTTGADTCTTGSFVVGTPDATDWQVGDGNPGAAFFTQPNSGGIGTEDVDGGTCEALSPSVDCDGRAAAEVSLDYYHGQRDAGDDAADGFTIEVLNDGAVVETLVAIGDVTSNPTWTTVSTVVTNPGAIQVRVRATDAAATGDIVEGGIDNVVIQSSGCEIDADCDDGQFCNGAETCAAGVCQAGSAPCEGSGLLCDEASDACVECLLDSDCDDGLFCNGAETCFGGSCQAGPAVDCNDSIDCTLDACNEGTDACDNVPDDNFCDNGVFCDGAETCDAGSGCQSGSDPCAGQFCDEGTETCYECEEDLDCDDGQFCNGVETCLDGVCQAGDDPCPGEGCDEAGDVCLPAGSCIHGTDFESGAGGWTNGADTCTTGSFTVGTPDATDWQVGGGNPGMAFFTQPNPGGIGSDDVDGGTCEALSPVVDCSGEAAAAVSLDYYHGQRDAGDDANDGFTIEVLNDGAVVDTLVAIGDVTSNPAWTTVSTVVTNPGAIRVRVRATDAAGAGDIVEGGIDNVSVSPTTPPLPCTVDDDFESGPSGWDNDPASTCSTGDYVLGNPTNPGGGQQIVGSHSGVNSWFTAVNASAGTNDVDGGNCILASPTWAVSEDSSLSVWYWHGQRDAGDDAAGDFFFLEYSTDGGLSWTTLASNGDAASTAVWSLATATIDAGSTVALRVQCSDGAGPGDLVECGIDDISICPQ